MVHTWKDDIGLEHNGIASGCYSVSLEVPEIRATIGWVGCSRWTGTCCGGRSL